MRQRAKPCPPPIAVQARGGHKALAGAPGLAGRLGRVLLFWIFAVLALVPVLLPFPME